MLIRFQKCRIFVIVKSLATSPIGQFIYYAFILSAMFTAICTFFLVNLYFINQQTLPNFTPDGKANDGAILLCLLEIFLLIIMICIIIFIRHLIRDTIKHVNKDIETFELNSIKWDN
jgi:ABC-type microcin C transport system permease subunit YejE